MILFEFTSMTPTQGPAGTSVTLQISPNARISSGTPIDTKRATFGQEVPLTNVECNPEAKIVTGDMPVLRGAEGDVSAIIHVELEDAYNNFYVGQTVQSFTITGSSDPIYPTVRSILPREIHGVGISTNFRLQGSNLNKLTGAYFQPIGGGPRVSARAFSILSPGVARCSAVLPVG